MNESPKVYNPFELNNQAKILESDGDFSGAEKMLLESSRLKFQNTGEDLVQVALSQKCFGRVVYEDGRKMGAC